MSRKALLGLLLAVLLGAGSLIAYQKKRPDLPPGVSEATWIPLTDNSGISLTANRNFPRTRDMHGILYVKVANVWQRLYLELSPAEPIPAN